MPHVANYRAAMTHALSNVVFYKRKGRETAENCEAWKRWEKGWLRTAPEPTQSHRPENWVKIIFAFYLGETKKGELAARKMCYCGNKDLRSRFEQDAALAPKKRERAWSDREWQPKNRGRNKGELGREEAWEWGIAAGRTQQDPIPWKRISNIIPRW